MKILYFLLPLAWLPHGMGALPMYSLSVVPLVRVDGVNAPVFKLVSGGFLAAKTGGDVVILEADTYAVRTDFPRPEGWYPGTGAVVAHDSGRFVTALGDRPVGSGYLENIAVASYDCAGAVTMLAEQRGIDPRAVSASGGIAGDGPNDASAWRYTPGSGWLNLGSLNPSGYAQAKGINDAGTVVGRTDDAAGDMVPFFYSDGAGMRAITDGAEPVYGEASAINDAGLVTGAANGRAFVFDGATMELKWLTPVADQKAVDINNAGQIIGQFNSGPILGIPGGSAWIATATDEWTHLASLIPGNLESGEWSINSVSDINDEGWILASAYNYNDRSSHRVLLRPVPEPGAAVLATAGGGLTLLRRRRKASGP